MERFIYTVSHELRSPLISVSGIVGFLRQDLENGDTKGTETDLKLMEGAMTKMDQLLGEILDLSRIGRVANPPADVPFGEIVTEALDQEAERLKSRGVEVSVASDLPKVHVDLTRIVEVLVNLIENSIRYMGDQPRPRIEIVIGSTGTRWFSLSGTTVWGSILASMRRSLGYSTEWTVREEERA